MRAKRTSRRPTVASPCSTTRTASPPGRRRPPKRNSSRSRKRTRCCAIPRSARPTIATVWRAWAGAPPGGGWASRLSVSPGRSTPSCETCGGTGEVRRAARSMFGQFVSVSPCPSCAGEGSVIRHPCPKCQGDGRVRAEKTIQIDVPAGVQEHHYLTMRGQGVPGSRNGPPGDLIAVLEIAEDPRFERHGDDLVYDLPVSFAQAALGAEVEVPTPYGNSTLKIQPGTQTGTIYRVKGKGLPRLGEGGRGDVHVRVHVWTPTKLTPEQEKLFKQLA